MQKVSKNNQSFPHLTALFASLSLLIPAHFKSITNYRDRFYAKKDELVNISFGVWGILAKGSMMAAKVTFDQPVVSTDANIVVSTGTDDSLRT